MEAVLDSSSLISLARSGLLGLAERFPFTPVILDEVWQEVVVSGIHAGHADAAAIEARLGDIARRPAARRTTVDAAVLHEAALAGLLIANDLALGRRARNLGATWLRTADVVMLLREYGNLDADGARASIVALRDAGRITPELAVAYLVEIG